MSEKFHLADDQLRELLHLLSHDVRNPLAAIVTNLEFARRLLTKMNLDPDLVDSIEDSVTACDVMRRIVSNFDLLVKGNGITVTIHETDVASLARDVVRRCGARAEQANLSLALNGDAAPLLAMVDKSLLALALENLLANSMQHAPRGSRIEVGLEDGDALHIRIADQGPPIPHALREKALGIEGHTSAGRREATRYGRGLGLLSARAACNAMGAELTIGDRVDGSEMVITIPTVG